MAIWIRNWLNVVGEKAEVSHFQATVSGIGCCERSFCVHRLANAIYPPGMDRVTNSTRPSG